MSSTSSATPSNYAAMWDLKDPTTSVIPVKESAFALGPGGGESVIGKDLRHVVSPADYSDGGKYRAIIKLFARYEKQPDDNNWGMGTGWLIAPDLIVTAGHVSFDFGKLTQYGRATIVKAYMGYGGASKLTPLNLSSGAVQLQYGKTFVTPAGWLQSGGQAPRSDVSFLKLAAPFTGNFNVFSYVDTPLIGTAEIISVVGFPADKHDATGEDGAEMYGMAATTGWDLDKSDGNLLQYQISTYRGQSGSPVIRKSDGASIGVHVLGNSGVNSASVINGRYGNIFDPFIRVFEEKSRSVGNILTVPIYKPATAGPDLLNLSTILNGTSGSGESAFGGSESSVEGFLDILKDIGKIALPIVNTGLQIATPFLGPLGAPAAGIAGVALGALGKACESAFDTNTQSLKLLAPPSPESLTGCAHRAVLAEAALQTALKLDSSSPEGKKIITEMATTYQTLKPLEALHPQLFPAIAGPTIRIALANSITPPASESAIEVRAPLPNATSAESAFSGSSNASFAKELLKPTIRLAGEEGFFSKIAPLIQNGLNYTPPTQSTNARKGVGAVIAVKGKDTESSMAASTPDTIISLPLFRRAIVAECALQAVQKIDTPALKNLTLYDERGNQSTEGFFDFMKTTIQKVGRKIVDTAPDVIRNVGPIALGLVADAIQAQNGGKGGGESGFTNGEGAGGGVNGFVPAVSIAALADSRPDVARASVSVSSFLDNSIPQPLDIVSASMEAASSSSSVQVVEPMESSPTRMSSTSVSSVVNGNGIAGNVTAARGAAPVARGQFKTTGFTNRDGLAFRAAPWKDDADSVRLRRS